MQQEGRLKAGWPVEGRTGSKWQCSSLAKVLDPKLLALNLCTISVVLKLTRAFKSPEEL